MPKKLIIGISVALVLVGAVVLTVLLIRSRALREEGPIDGGTNVTDGTGAATGTGTGIGTGSGGPPTVPGSTGGSGTSSPAGPADESGPCGDGICSQGESWCRPDCGNEEERFANSI